MQYKQSMYNCAALAGKPGVKKIVAMAGLPAGSPDDTTPNWITSTVSWPDLMEPAYQLSVGSNDSVLEGIRCTLQKLRPRADCH